MHAAAEREWRTTRRKPLANRELWERLLELDGYLAVSWRHVRGHRPKRDTSDDARYNREVDVLAVEARRVGQKLGKTLRERIQDREQKAPFPGLSQ